MKSIKYSITAIAIFIVMAFSMVQNNAKNQTIIIQSSDNTISSSLLSKSAEIISKRLNSLNEGKSDVKVIENMKQIKVTLTGEWDIPSVNSLLEKKGNVEFYIAYNQEELAKLLNGKPELFSLLSKNQSDNGGSVIGCAQGSGIKKVNDYIKTLDLSQKCRFVWSHDLDGTKSCLYALKISGDKGAVMNSDGIESANYGEGKISIKLNQNSSVSFAKVTRENINEIMAIVLDDNVISAPRIRSEINFGKIEISGNFSKTEAGYIASVINSGPLPDSFKIIK